MSDGSRGGGLRPISVSDDGHFLVRPDGAPFFWLADTAWELFSRLDLDEADHYFADRAARGFTVVQAVLPGRVHGDWTMAPNRYGHSPFRSRDLGSPREEYWAHVDRVLERAARHGLIVAVLPLWSSLAVAERKPPIDPVAARSYARWLGERYRGCEVVWVLGGDVTPIWFADVRASWDLDAPIATIDHSPVYDALAAGLRAGFGDDAFITYHPCPLAPPGAPPARTSRYFGDRDWLAMNMLESGQSDLGRVDEGGGRLLANWAGSYMLSAPFNYVAVGAEYRSTPTRPVIDGETRYEAHPVDIGAGVRAKGRLWSDWDSRNGAYHALFAGAAGHTYGHVSIWDFHVAAASEPNPYVDSDVERVDWREALAAPGGSHMRHAKELLLGLPYFSRIPDDSIVLSSHGGGADHVGATRDRNGRFVAAYLPRGGRITVETAVLAGPIATVSWVDPRTGEIHREPDPIRPEHPHEFTAPDAGEESDWILLLDTTRP